VRRQVHTYWGTASSINSNRQPTARHSGPRWSPHQKYLALGRNTTRESVLHMSNHLDALQILEKMARALAKMVLAVLAVEKEWGLRATPGWLRAWEE
jgi:hypothetical protein